MELDLRGKELKKTEMEDATKILKESKDGSFQISLNKHRKTREKLSS
jgi:hypothetical protein